MPVDPVHEAIIAALSDRWLLDHPFYRRWEAGDLGPAELAAYAEQYRHLEHILPSVLRTITAKLSEQSQRSARRLVEQNLADEEGVPEPHRQLFEGFATAVGARPAAAATPATERLVATELEAAHRSALDGLAVLAAYEVQAPAIAATKGDALRSRYGVPAAGTRFWDVHAAMEADHADWSTGALGALGAGPAVAVPARRAAEAWWAFLDERAAAA